MSEKNHYSKFMNRKHYPVLYKINGRKTIIILNGLGPFESQPIFRAKTDLLLVQSQSPF